MSANVGPDFQSQTKYRRGAMPKRSAPPGPKPPAVKTYPEASRVALETPDDADGEGLWDTIRRRRSVRHYDDPPMGARDLSQLLWATQGVTRRAEGFAFRAAPSAGALYPVETYLVVNRVEGLEAGLYHYAVGDHALERLKGGDFRDAIARAALDQGVAYFAHCVFVWSAVFERSAWKYLHRAWRYVYLDAGHVAQNLALAAVALGLGSCQIAALYDDEANQLLGLDGETESVIYMSTVGRPKA